MYSVSGWPRGQCNSAGACKQLYFAQASLEFEIMEPEGGPGTQKLTFAHHLPAASRRYSLGFSRRQPAEGQRQFMYGVAYVCSKLTLPLFVLGRFLES